MTWPLNGSEAAGDLIFINTSLFCCVNEVVLMVTSWHLNEKSRGGSVSPPASIVFISQVTKCTTVKWSIVRHEATRIKIVSKVNRIYLVNSLN